LASAVGRLERRLCRDAHVVFACSDEDAEHLATVSKTARDKFVTVPNGVDVDQIRPVDAEERRRLKAELGLLPDRAAAIFIGSGYLPNVEAASFIVRHLAPALPQCQFLIVGGVKDSFGGPNGVSAPANVRWTGVVDGDRKLWMYQASDIGVNPMF